MTTRVTKLAPAPRAEFDPGRGCLRIRISSEVPDRDDEVVVPRTLRLDAYRRNPVVLWAHDQKGHPVAKCEDDTGNFRVWLDDASGDLWAEFHFADTAAARDVAALYRQKVLRGASIGFTSDGLEDVRPDEARRRYGTDRRLKRHTGGELLEISCVPVPACPAALATDWISTGPAALVVARGYADRAGRRPLAGLVRKGLTLAVSSARATAPVTMAQFQPSRPTAARGPTVSQTVTDTKALGTADDTAGGATVPPPEPAPADPNDTPDQADAPQHGYGVKALTCLATGLPMLAREAADHAAMSDADDVKEKVKGYCKGLMGIHKDVMAHAGERFGDHGDHWAEIGKAAGETYQDEDDAADPGDEAGDDFEDDEPEEASDVETKEDDTDDEVKALLREIATKVTAIETKQAEQDRTLADVIDALDVVVK